MIRFPLSVVLVVITTTSLFAQTPPAPAGGVPTTQPTPAAPAATLARPAAPAAESRPEVFTQRYVKASTMGQFNGRTEYYAFPAQQTEWSDIWPAAPFTASAGDSNRRLKEVWCVDPGNAAQYNRVLYAEWTEVDPTTKQPKIVNVELERQLVLTEVCQNTQDAGYGQIRDTFWVQESRPGQWKSRFFQNPAPADAPRGSYIQERWMFKAKREAANGYYEVSRWLIEPNGNKTELSRERIASTATLPQTAERMRAQWKLTRQISQR